MTQPRSPGPFWFHLRWALREFCLHRVRTALSVLGVAIAVTLLVCIRGFHQGYREALKRNIDGLGFELLVTAKGCPYEAATMVLSGGKIPMYIDETFAAQIAAYEEVGAITRLFMQTVPRQDGSGTLYFLGVDDQYPRLKPWIRFQQGGWFSSDDAEEAILGYNVASRLSLQAGDLFFQDELGRELRIQGVLERTGTQDDGTVLLPFRFAQWIFDKKDKLTGLGVKVRELDLIDQLYAKVYALPSVQVVTMSQVQGAVFRLVSAARALLLVGGVLALLVAVGGLLNTLLTSVFERLRELGILKAMGATGGRLYVVVLLESLLVCLCGAAAGLAGAWSLRSVLETVLRRTLPYVPEGDVIALPAPVLWQTFGLALVMALFASLWPALKAGRAAPSLTMRLHE